MEGLCRMQNLCMLLLALQHPWYSGEAELKNIGAHKCNTARMCGSLGWCCSSGAVGQDIGGAGSDPRARHAGCAGLVSPESRSLQECLSVEVGPLCSRSTPSELPRRSGHAAATCRLGWLSSAQLQLRAN